MFSRFLSMLTLPLRRIFTSPLLMIGLSVLTYSVLQRVDEALGTNLYGLLSKLAANFRLIFADESVYQSDIQLNTVSLVVSALVLVFMCWWVVIAVIRKISAVSTDFVGQRSEWVGQMLAVQRGRKAMLALHHLHAIRPDGVTEAKWLEDYVYKGTRSRGFLVMLKDAAIDLGLTLFSVTMLLLFIQWVTPLPALDWGLGMAKALLAAAMAAAGL